MSDVKLDKSCIQWQEEVTDWREAIKVSAEPLLKQGKITENYIQAMIDNIDNLGPYILIAPNVALPHARPEAGVNERGIALTVFKKDVEFPAGTDNKSDTARLFICLAATDSETHLNFLKGISSWIEDEKFINRLLETESQEETNDIINEFYSKN
ncbi:PTS sugar transporter subunit IIA [Salipaludibacillus sp. CUR1]|uniref:PTS sugar transporter subunit IIA n=1 Tax=Salipaludibacillus sp. CUR1 TaxID=2820003 RepID=UPI001E4220B0|nr:PTS sugar transporter subunit IIA [Salipaludibacillus sp. CUR1]